MAKAESGAKSQGKAEKVKAKPDASKRSRVDSPAVGTDVKPKEYNAVVRDAQLLDVVLNESYFKVEPEYVVSEESNRSFHYKHNMRHHLDSVSILGKGRDGGVVGADVVWDIRAKVGRKIGLKITAAYTVLYTGLQEHSDDAVMLFLERVAPVATYAYFRALVSQYNWAGEVDLPILPVYSSHH